MRHTEMARRITAWAVILVMVCGVFCTDFIRANADDGTNGSDQQSQGVNDGTGSGNQQQNGNGTGNENQQQDGNGDRHESDGDYQYNEGEHWFGCTYTGCTEHRYNVASHSYDGWTDVEGEDVQISKCICGDYLVRSKPSGGGGKTPGGYQTTPGEERQTMREDEQPSGGEGQSTGGDEQPLSGDEQPDVGDQQAADDNEQIYGDNTQEPVSEQTGTEALNTAQTVPETHTHIWGSGWLYDEKYHWRACTVSGCAEIYSRGEHISGSIGGLSFETQEDGVIVENYQSECMMCGKRFIHYGNTVLSRRDAAEAVGGTGMQTAVVQNLDTQKYISSTLEAIRRVTSEDFTGMNINTSWIELGTNTAFNLDMLNAMRNPFGRAQAEYRFVFTHEGERFLAVIPKGADLSMLPGGDSYIERIGSRFWSSSCEGIMYVAQVSGGTVTKITEADSDKGGGEFGGRIDMGSADTYTGRFPNANIYQIDASGNEANYGVTVKKMEDSVQAAASGDVVAVNLGATSALSGSFFRAAADENGLTRTNMVFRYAIPEASEGALRETVIPAGTDISSLVTGGKVEGILYLEQVTGCSGTVIQASQDIEASEHADPMWQGLLQSGHF